MSIFNQTQPPAPVKLEPIDSPQQRPQEAQSIPLIATIPCPPKWTTLQAIFPKNYYNIACQVIGRCMSNNSETVLRVWDGTIPKRKYHRCTEFDDGIVATLDHEANASVYDYSVDIRVYDAFATIANNIQYVCFVNLHSYVNREQQETLTLHGGDPALYRRFNRGIYSIPDDHTLSRALNGRLKLTYSRLSNAANGTASNSAV